MRYLSLFSGIEAATVAWEGLGWEAVAFAEIEPFPSRKLAHAYPDVPNLGDVTQITEAQIAALGPIDIVVFGSPCQDLSVAGKRAGLAGARSGLFHTAVEIIQWARRHGGCRWALWENVPGAFSSNAGRDFATVVDLLAGTQCDVPPKGWGTEGVCIGEEALVEWSTLDAQWFGVPQRRRRVFALADFGDWTGRPPILLEPEGMRGDSAPRREAGESVTGTLAARSSAGGGLGTDFDLDGGLRPCVSRDVVSTLDTSYARLQGCSGMDANHGHSHLICMAHGQGGAEISVDRGPTLTCNHEAPIVAHTLKGDGFDASEDGTGRGIPLIAFNGRQDPDSWVDRTGPLDTDGGTQCVAFDTTQITSKTNRSNPQPGDPCHPLVSTGHAPAIVEGDIHASTQEANPTSILSALRGEVGEEAFAEWGSRVLDSLQSEEVLRSWLHGKGLRCQTSDRQPIVDDSAPSREEGEATRALRMLWENGPDGRTSQGRQLAEQLAREFGKALPVLPHSSPPIRTTWGVRRITPVEAERLQGFPDQYTRIDGKTADGPRYKALGNSMAVPVIRWIGQRIDLSDLVGVYP